MTTLEIQQAEAKRFTATRWAIWAAPAVGFLILAALLLILNGVGPAQAPYWRAHQLAFLWMNRSLSELPQAVWCALTLLGDEVVLLMLLAPLLLLRPDLWVAVLSSAPAEGLLSFALKFAFGVPRPAAVLDQATAAVTGHLLHGNSFPSGHSITAFSALAALLLTLRLFPGRSRKWHSPAAAALGLLSAVLVALSRVALGAHWPLDVFVGAAVGWLAGLSGAAIVWRYGWRWFFAPAGRPFVIAGLAGGGLLVLLKQHQLFFCAVVANLAVFSATSVAIALFWRSRVQPALKK